MDVVQQFDEQTYDDQTGRVYPIDKYEIPAALLERCREYRFLKVPLMGQYFSSPYGGKQDWCGRTSSSMLYNYFELVRGGDPKSRYITHWNAGKYSFLDLRLPSGERAFHKHPTSPPFDRKLDGVKVNAAITEYWPHFRKGTLLPYARTQARLDQAAAIASNETRIRARFASVIEALEANNPMVVYTGFSRQKSTPGHLILIVGYAMIDEGGSEHLWIAMADPSTATSKIVGAKKGGIQFFRTPGAATGRGDDIAALSKLSSEHNFIRIKNGDWYAQQGSLVLVRARAFFEQNTVNEASYDLLMDDFLNEGRKGGTFMYSTTPTEVPDAVVESSDRRAMSLPFDDPKDPRGPIAYLHDNEVSEGGFYPLGLFRNVHSGVHLLPPVAAQSGVRAAAAGQIVAVRLAGAMPPDVAQGQGDPGRPARAEELTGTSNAMVLVRHTVELAPEPKAGADDGGTAAADAETLTLYSLYMHLSVPNWSSPSADYADVPWLNALMRRRGGSLSIVDPDRSDFGGTLWPVEPAADPLVKGGAWQVYGGRFTQREAIDLGAASGRVRAVAKPADEDLQETLQALADGKVVTFAPAFADMFVSRGELLGFVPSTSALGRGFLHFEMLAPAGAGLTELVRFAEQRLGMAGLFGEFQEETDNNFFDAGGGEMDDLVGLLPDGGAGVTINNNYGPAELRALMRKADQLPFATEAEPQPEDALVYPSTLRLHSYRDAMPAGDYPVSLTFRGGDQEHATTVTASVAAQGPTDVTVMVPAWAESVEVASDDFHVQAGGPRPTQQEEVEHLSRVAGARWRNVKLTHLNEWSPDGLETSLRARFTDAGDAITPLIDAMAWWGHDEEPVVGPEGSEPSLFVDGGQAHQLPATGELENLHPVMTVWMLELLARHRHVKIVEPRAPVAGGEPTAVQWAGWLPALDERPTLAVGDPVLAVAVSEASPAVPSHGEVVVQAVVEGGPTVTLGGGAWERDIVRVATSAWFWGRAQLSIEGASAQSLGAPVLEVHAPVLDTAAPVAAPRALTGKKSNRFTWSIPFSDHCPRALMGWVTFKAWVGDPRQELPEASAFTEAHIGLPVHAVRRGSATAPGGPVIEGGYIVQGPASAKTHVSRNFTWQEYLDAADAPPKRVAESLVQGVQAVRTAYGSSIWLSSLSADGLSLRIKGSSTAQVLKRAGDHDGFASAAKVGEGPWIEVRVDAPAVVQGVPGVVDLEFDPSDAYVALLDELQPAPQKQVHVIMGARFFNGGPLIDAELLEVDACGSGATAGMDWDGLTGLAAGSTLEVFASTPSAVLSRPAFGVPTWGITGNSLVVSVPLIGGDKRMWTACKPKLAVGGRKVGTIATISGAAPGEPRYRLTASLNMGSSRYKSKALTVTATVTKSGVTYGGAQVAIADSEPLDYDTRPRVESVVVVEAPADEPDRIEIEAQTYGIPSSRSLALYFTAEGTAEADWAALPVHYSLADAWGNGKVTGLCDAQGVFRASVSLESLSAVLRPEAAPRAYTVEVGRKWGAVLGKTVESASVSGQLAPPPAEDGTEEDPGPVQGGMNAPEDDQD